MIGKELWQSMKALVVCDNDIKKAEEEISTAQNNLNSTNKQIDNLKNLLDSYKTQLTQEKKNIDFYELQAQTLEDNENNKRKQLENIKNQKEYKALEKEISSLSTQREDLDDLMLRTYHQADLDKNKIAKEQELNEQKITQLTLDLETLKTLLVTINETLNAAHTKRKELAGKIPTEWLTRYERMKHNVPDPIVPVLNNCCSACFYSILLQDMAKLKKSGLLPCRNCYRFLYYDQEEEKDNQQASY